MAAGLSVLLSIAFQNAPSGPPWALIGAVGIAPGAAVAGWLARARGAFHGGLVAVLWIAAEALSEPLRPAAADVVSDTALAIVGDVVRIAAGVVFGWIGGRARR